MGQKGGGGGAIPVSRASSASTNKPNLTPTMQFAGPFQVQLNTNPDSVQWSKVPGTQL